MNQWIADLRSLLATEYAHRPYFAVLATVDAAGRPHGRTVICRRIGDDGSVLLTSSTQSQKNADIAARASAELVFWMQGIRHQYRLAGEAAILPTEHPLSAALWGEMSPASRALFAWPASGRVRQGDAVFPSECHDPTPPAGFSVIRVSPERVESLDLRASPHLRRCWQRASGWSETILNP